MSYVGPYRPCILKKAFPIQSCTSDSLLPSGVWYVTEGSPDDDDDFIFFGFVKGPGEEWREFSLSELHAFSDFGLSIERDVDFKPGRLSQIMSAGGR